MGPGALFLPLGFCLLFQAVLLGTPISQVLSLRCLRQPCSWEGGSSALSACDVFVLRQGFSKVEAKVKAGISGSSRESTQALGTGVGGNPTVTP